MNWDDQEEVQGLRTTIDRLVQYLAGDDEYLNNPDVKETPRRVFEAYKEMLGGHEFNLTVTENTRLYDEVVLEQHIPFTSMCIHHLLPFYGEAAVAYIPNAKLAGLSKLARIVEHFARQLQLQESLTQDIGLFIEEQLEPVATAVIIQAEHGCMRCRGVRKPGVITKTSFLKGAFRDKPEARLELMLLMGL